MRVSDVIALLDEFRPNGLSASEKLRVVNTLEARLHALLLAPYGAEEFTPHATSSEALLLDPPGDELYLYYLMSQVDYLQGDATAYANDALQFNARLLDAQKRALRAEAPAGKQITV